MRTLIVVGHAKHATKLQRELDDTPSQDHFVVAPLFSSLAGSRFDRIIVHSEAVGLDAPWIEVLRRIEELRARLNREGRLVIL